MIRWPVIVSFATTCRRVRPLIMMLAHTMIQHVGYRSFDQIANWQYGAVWSMGHTQQDDKSVFCRRRTSNTTSPCRLLHIPVVLNDFHSRETTLAANWSQCSLYPASYQRATSKLTAKPKNSKIFHPDQAPYPRLPDSLVRPIAIMPLSRMENTTFVMPSIIDYHDMGLRTVFTRFVKWAQNEIAIFPDFHKRNLFSDEAHFWLNGYVNKQNCRIWSEANPQVYVETPLHPEKLTVWSALRAGGILLQKR
ncbi:hypothetical protein TNCV_4275281 [Trichonephila clavipes]|nr:hypothetical protein TNCV_4275281 [Trichonephila clavipes]